MAEYGIPYMGSKDSIAKELIKIFPNADNFYDLFGGGFSITHAILRHRSRDYKEFHFNEIRPGVCDLIKDAIAGKYNYDVFKPKFITKEEFHQKKESDIYIKIVWSFGNNGKTYLFGDGIIKYKQSLHNAIVFNKFDDLAAKTLGMDRFKDGYSINARRLLLRNRIEFFRRTKIPDFLLCYLSPEQLQQLQQLERLEQLQQLQQLEQLEQLERLHFYNQSYEQVPIKDNSIIYCDIPYQNTTEYDENKTFDHSQFLNWAADNKAPIFISEYYISDKRFTEVFNIKKRSILSPDGRELKTERVYTNSAGLAAIRQRRLATSLRYSQQS